jgi:hypothetical protein
MGAKRIPISAAKEIAKRYGQDQVIMMTFDKETGLTHVVSYGKTKLDCEQAAHGANLMKKTLKFPEELCNSVPARTKNKIKVEDLKELHLVVVTEYERNWGAKEVEKLLFTSKQEAMDYVTKFNSKNNCAETPDWYESASYRGTVI